ncbi:hypothetical protein GFL93_35920 [Rhizobium leguminosarum bv. viciae]|uniref:Uncharacterized protein n=1 Tax=Rhizobium leguminosarum bv. viciae TaxID=387 RepID=A0A8G2IUY8_RHILV|nr:hypothetical protein [Rhizobium leguminosarum bv. viciae]NKK24979.1 hypothetical protein [Rhizobium leguminosarum bv. viciae]TBX88917.1 hypothetical protein E0H31_24870 [Rhizobium leguminosarum bv. viciae]TBZ14118.1 hypothetical protein E0H52_25950 [Rhizobium leguminosarum bv. viciae]
MPCESERGTERARDCLFAPFTGRRWRQPDEGPASAFSWAEEQKMTLNRAALQFIARSRRSR